MARIKYVRVNQALRDLLDTYRVRSAMKGDTWKLGDVLRVHSHAIVEPYCLLGEGCSIPRVMSAFSYTLSEPDLGMRIGRYTSIAEGVAAIGTPHPTEWVSSSPFSYHSNPRRPFAEFFADRGMAEPELLDFDYGARQIIIGHDVWIGAHAVIKQGVEIGQGAVIGTRSVVTRDVPPYAIVAGVPARIIRYRFPETLIARLQALNWWRFTPDQLRPLDIRDPERFADQLEEQIADGMTSRQLRVLTAAEICKVGELQP